MQYVIIIGIILLLFLAMIIVQSRRTEELRKKEIKESWGRAPKKCTKEELNEIKQYYNSVKKGYLEIDDITWNDIDMDSIFNLINQTGTSLGEEYLYAMLRMPSMSETELREREELITYFQNHQNEREQLQNALYTSGKLKDHSFHSNFGKLKQITSKRGKHLCLGLGFFLSCILLFTSLVKNTWIGPAVLLFVVLLATNIVEYSNRKAQIGPYYRTISYVLRMLYSVSQISEENLNDIKNYMNELNEVSHSFQSFRKKARIVMGGKYMSGSIVDIFMDYVKMLFHIDLIMFDSLTKELIRKSDEVNRMFEIIGLLDSMIAIASFRAYLENGYCVPELIKQKNPMLAVEDVYHPLVKNPVKNSLNEKDCVLLTGSNASGKSTFIKTIAINTILAQTIHTCPAKYYRASFFQVASSMALADNLEGQESYYIVEIKSLKRILDNVNQNVPMLCFVDEVLRGTNTLERIAASSQILKSLSKTNTQCVAATHDIELTYILEKFYKNYHFREHIEGKEVVFDYKLQTGRAMSRNAIKLLEMIGYEESIIKNATIEANYFLETGVWRNIEQ